MRVITQVALRRAARGLGTLRLRGPADRLDWAVLGLLGVFAVVCLLSRDRTESLGALGLATAYAAWFLLMRRAGDLRTTIVVAVATGLALTLAFNAVPAGHGEARVVRGGRSGTHSKGIGRSRGSPSTRSRCSCWSPSRSSRGWSADGCAAILAIVVGVSAVVVVPISLGRAGWLGLTVAAVVAARSRRHRRGRLLDPNPVMGARRGTGGAALWSCSEASCLSGPRLVRAIGESGRLLLWEQGLNMVRARSPDRLWTGHVLMGAPRVPAGGADLLAVRLLHDAPLQTLVDGGLILLALRCWRCL